MNRTLFVAAVVSISVSAFAGRAGAQSQSALPQLDFSATMVSTAPNGKQVSAKVYRAGLKMRTDMPGGEMHTVLLLDKKEMFMVTPQMCMKMEVPQTSTQPLAMKGKVERTRVGTGTANGHPAIIENVTVTPADGGKPTTMKVWQATDLKGFAVRIEIPTPSGTMRIDYKDIDLSTPSASLFAMPDNCRVMPTMPGMPHPRL